MITELCSRGRNLCVRGTQKPCIIQGLRAICRHFPRGRCTGRSASQKLFVRHGFRSSRVRVALRTLSLVTRKFNFFFSSRASMFIEGVPAIFFFCWTFFCFFVSSLNPLKRICSRIQFSRVSGKSTGCVMGPNSLCFSCSTRCAFTRPAEIVFCKIRG